MTLQNLRYILTIAECSSLSEAAKRLFITQSSLSAAVKDIEDELGIQIFLRTNRGITITPEGKDCVKYCREIVERTDYLSERYRKADTPPLSFFVSTQHLPFAVRAFNQFISGLDDDRFNLGILECNTEKLLEDVSTGTSELGIAAFNGEQLELLGKTLSSMDLSFHELDTLGLFVFMKTSHPLAEKETLSREDLNDYIYVTYDSDNYPHFYNEDIAPGKPFERTVYVRDRASKMAVVRGMNAFCIGVDLPNFNRDIYFRRRNTELVAIPYDSEEKNIHIGYISRNNTVLSENAGCYLSLLTEHLKKLRLPITE